MFFNVCILQPGFRKAMKTCSILDFRENGEGMRDQDTLPSRTCSCYLTVFIIAGHHWQHWRWSSVQQGGSQFRGVTGQSPSHSLPHQRKEGLRFPSACGELIKPEAGRTRERVPSRIDGRLRNIIVQVEVCTLQDENIKLCVDKNECEEIKSVDQETMDIKRKIWEAIHFRC